MSSCKYALSDYCAAQASNIRPLVRQTVSVASHAVWGLMNCERRVYDPEMKRVMRIMIVEQQDRTRKCHFGECAFYRTYVYKWPTKSLFEQLIAADLCGSSIFNLSDVKIPLHADSKAFWPADPGDEVVCNAKTLNVWSSYAPQHFAYTSSPPVEDWLAAGRKAISTIARAVVVIWAKVGWKCVTWLWYGNDHQIMGPT